jgi:hypothetical protein
MSEELEQEELVEDDEIAEDEEVVISRAGQMQYKKEVKYDV